MANENRVAVVYGARWNKAAAGWLEGGKERTASSISSSSNPMATARFRSTCPGRKPPFSAVKRPARPSKNTIQNQFTVENARGAEPPRAGPDRDALALQLRTEVDQPSGGGRWIH